MPAEGGRASHDALVFLGWPRADTTHAAFLPANKIEIREFENRLEVDGVARDENGSDLARTQSDEDIEV